MGAVLVEVYSNGGYLPADFPRRDTWHLMLYRNGTLIASTAGQEFVTATMSPAKARRWANRLARTLDRDDWGRGTVMDAQTTHVEVHGPSEASASVYGLGMNSGEGISPEQSEARDRLERTLARIAQAGGEQKPYTPEGYAMYVTPSFDSGQDAPLWTGPQWASCQVISPTERALFPQDFSQGKAYQDTGGATRAVWAFVRLPRTRPCTPR